MKIEKKIRCLPHGPNTCFFFRFSFFFFVFGVYSAVLVFLATCTKTRRIAPDMQLRRRRWRVARADRQTMRRAAYARHGDTLRSPANVT